MTRFISKYLSLLIIVPAVLLVVVLAAESGIAVNNISNAKSLQRHVNLALVTNQLVHELQKERGMSAGFIGSKGASFASALPDQRRLTDNALSELKTVFDSDTYSEQVTSEINTLIRELDRLTEVRGEISSLSMSLGDALSFYTGHNTSILELNGLLADYASDSQIKQNLIVVFNFAFGKEQAGIERAVLSNGFGRDNFDDNLFRRFITLTTKQQSYIHEAEILSDSDGRATIERFLNSPEHKAVLGYRAKLDGQREGFAVNPEDWFAASTARINILKRTQDTLLNSVLEDSMAAVSKSYAFLLLYAAMLAISIGLTVMLYRTTRLTRAQSDEIGDATAHIIDEHDLRVRVNQVSQDQLGKAANRINQIIGTFQKDLVTFQDFSHQIASATHETAVSISQSETNLENQQRDVETIAQATEQMNANVREVTDAMQSSSESVSQVSKELHAGNDRIITSVEGIESLAHEVEALGGTIDELNQGTDNIAAMVDMIQSVAEQTNLLALNAAIEAARAGEQGRGFAVVADEVRALASRTKQATEEISAIVEQLQIGTSNATTVIATSRDKAGKAVNDSNEIRNVLDSIVHRMEEVDGITSQVFTSASEQLEAIGEVTRRITEIDNQAAENVEGAKQVGEAASRLAEIAMDMQTKVDSYQTH